MLRQVRLELLRAFRAERDPPRKIRTVRLCLSDADKQRLAERVWVRSDGAIFSRMRGGAPVELAQQTKHNGYKCIQLSLGSRRQFKFMVHRLVLWAFHGDALLARAAAARAAGDLDHAAPDDFEAGHLDDDRTNNDARNIAPLTRIENVRQSHARADRRSHARAQSRPVVLVDAGPRAPPDLPFAAGHEFESYNEAARRLNEALREGNFTPAGIWSSVNRNTRHRGFLFANGRRADDEDEEDEAWRPAPESGSWCETLGQAIRVSNRGRVWRRRGNIKSRGHEPGGLYRTLNINGRVMLAHTVVWRLWNGAWNARGEWVAADIAEGLWVLHGGAGRAPNAVRRADGYERNWPVDLRLGTQAENAADMKHERSIEGREAAAYVVD
jgi:hypothetical protein